MKKILGIDPGGTTGWAVIEGRTKEKPYFNFLGWGSCKGWTALENMLREYVPKVDVVVVENFVLRPQYLQRLARSRKWVQLEEPEKVGLVKGWAKSQGKILVKQEPADLDTARRMHPELEHKGDRDEWRHAKDGLGHCIIYNHRVLGSQR